MSVDTRNSFAATAHARKVLLTATPLQNSAMELVGLLSFIDPHSFCSEESFRALYLSLANEGRFQELRRRIKPFLYHTLRRQVLEFIKYTKRIAVTETNSPAEAEQSFYEDFTAWLGRTDLYSVPKSQRALLTLVLTKHLLVGNTVWDDQKASFRYQGESYSLVIDEASLSHTYRIQHPLARQSAHDCEELLVIGALMDDGSVLHPEVARKLFQLPSTASSLTQAIPEQLQAITDFQRQVVQEEARQRQRSYFSTEIDKLDLWAEDLKNGLELRIKEMESERNQARKRLFDAQDEIDAKRNSIIAGIEGQLAVEESLGSIVRLYWYPI